ncbi:MAG: glycosyltransferase family 2 protein [Alphaproteobacteria bacterium]|nr:glycosyltransferase family 2 protein [Alphaproteobacteria bacterium]
MSEEAALRTAPDGPPRGLPDGAEPAVTVLVVSYNTREITLAALRSALAETSAPMELIVVDNASADGSADAIAREIPQARLIRLAENIGFGRANNLGARQARGRYLLLLNPDTVVLEGAIDRLLAFAQARPEARIWGGQTLYGDRTLNPTNCYRRLSLWNLFCRSTGLSALFPASPVLNSELYGGWKRDTERAVDVITGCFLLIERSFWEALGGFEPAFFMYGEETDLCLRARAQGARPRVTPQARIIHYGGASEKVRAQKVIRLFTAKVELIRRHFPPATRWLALGLFAAWPLIRVLALSVLARLRPSPARAEALANWRAVWQARGTWLKGYAPA